MGPACQWSREIRGLEISVPSCPSDLLRGVGRWIFEFNHQMVSDLINRAYVMKPSSKLKRVGFGDLAGW